MAKISVRNLVEFIMRSGDLDNRSSHADMNAMQIGSRLHKKLQKQAGGSYLSEVALKLEIPVSYDGEELTLQLEGRADGIYNIERADFLAETMGRIPEGTEEVSEAVSEADSAPYDGILTVIDEIKTTYSDVSMMDEPVGVHRAQAMCYAAMYCELKDLKEMGIRMTYCNQETLEVRYFKEYFAASGLIKWLDELVHEYAKWAVWEKRWKETRDSSILASAFPFEYREGQKKLVTDVYKTINRSRNLFIEAPTGVGKTISTVFPAVWSMGEGKVDKIFYGTAKTIARTVAEQTFSILIEKGVKLKVITITSKEKLCVLDKPNCNPMACERARGHFDRVNDAVYDMLTHEERITRETVEEYALKHEVCPFEMCLDVSTWSDAVICDYNYIFDPEAHLKRFFDESRKNNYCLLLDEAHNLVERAREMFSAHMTKEDFLKAKNAIAPGIASQYPKNTPKGKLSAVLNSCNKALLALKHECDEFTQFDDCANFCISLMHFTGAFEEHSRHMSAQDNDALTDLYFEARHFLEMYDLMDNDYTIYSDYNDKREFTLHLQCMDPSSALKSVLDKVRSAIFFSATLLPIRYYVEQLGGSNEDYSVYAPSPFDTGNRLLMIAGDVSTKYTRRTDSEYSRMAEYIKAFTSAKTGNYLVFFPSYRMLERVAQELSGFEGLRLQPRSMTELEKEEFLESFEENPDKTNVGFCVMGGIFSEGIDLKADRLIGVVIAGTGLPMVCNERELFRKYFDEHKNMGFEYAYLYNGMNKVMQAAGRVIRTMDDRGAILLMDERFLTNQYMELFPQEWSDYKLININSMSNELNKFWHISD